MVAIYDLIKYFEDAKESLEGLKEVVPVFNQANLSEKIKELSNGIYLIIVIPGARTKAADEDNVRDPSECLVFLSEKLNDKDITPDILIKKMAITQQLTDTLKKKMIQDKLDHDHPGHLMHDLEPSGISMEPEYNYLGTYGWSLAFNITLPL